MATQKKESIEQRKARERDEARVKANTAEFKTLSAYYVPRIERAEAAGDYVASLKLRQRRMLMMAEKLLESIGAKPKPIEKTLAEAASHVEQLILDKMNNAQQVPAEARIAHLIFDVLAQRDLTLAGAFSIRSVAQIPEAVAAVANYSHMVGKFGALAERVMNGEFYSLGSAIDEAEKQRDGNRKSAQTRTEWRPLAFAMLAALEILPEGRSKPTGVRVGAVMAALWREKKLPSKRNGQPLRDKALKDAIKNPAWKTRWEQIRSAVSEVLAGNSDIVPPELQSLCDEGILRAKAYLA
jgi:hypothetical protein